MSTWAEQRRADKAAEAEQRRKDQDAAADRQLKMRLEAEKVRAEEQRKDKAEKRRLEQLDRKAKEQEKEKKAAAKAERRAKLRATLSTKSVEVFVGSVMAAALVPAFISQAAFLTHEGLALPLACLAAAAVEGATWAFTAMAAKAEKEHRPTTRLRIGTWVCAVFAGVLNLAHWTETNGPVIGVFFGLLTPLATLLWDWRTHTSTRTKEERQEAKARRKHAKRRAKLHKEVAAEAERIATALPFGELSEEDAFATAWRITRGAEPGMDATTYATLTDAQLALGAAFELGEHVRPELVRTGMLAAAYNPLKKPLGTVFPVLGPLSSVDAQRATEKAAKPQAAAQVPTPVLRAVESEKTATAKGEKKRPVPPRRRKGDTPKFHPAARVAAADTARRVAVTASTS